MFSGFCEFFNVEAGLAYTDEPYQDFITQLGGTSYGNGLFNSFSVENVNYWTEMVGEAFPFVAGKFRLFGYDWLGRVFGIDLRKGNVGNVLMFEIGTGQVLEIPSSFTDFLNSEIAYFSDACMARSFYEEWINYTGEFVSYGQCIGYKNPLFMGGNDEIENMEISDMEVYWVVLTQLLKKNSNGVYY